MNHVLLLGIREGADDCCDPIYFKGMYSFNLLVAYGIVVI